MIETQDEKRLVRFERQRGGVEFLITPLGKAAHRLPGSGTPR